MFFKHTSSEPRLWRGCLKNGQSVEVSTQKSRWCFGAGIHMHDDDTGMASRLLFMRLWRLTIVLPLGLTSLRFPAMEGPQWSAYVYSEHGLTLHFGNWHRSFDLPWFLHTLHYEEQLPNGSWQDVFAKYRDGKNEPHYEKHPYTYVLKSGEIQNRTATVNKTRHVLCRVMFKWFGWPRWIEESINISFDAEVGERTGSWKGGCTGCAYDLRKDENMLDALRRMETERKF